MKKIALAATAVLLFSALTAIIIFRSGQTPETVETVSVGSFETTLVIDPGHGGLDGGAVSPEGMTESAVNLAVAQRLEAVSNLFGIKTVMTRTSEELDYPEEESTVSRKKVWDQKSRVALINSTPNALLISIHQNKFPDKRPSGSQVLYAGAAGSRELGELMHEMLIKTLCPDNRRVASPISEKIYLMKNVNCPAVLVECGFLSNPTEAALLAEDVYRMKLAIVMLASFLQFAE